MTERARRLRAPDARTAGRAAPARGARTPTRTRSRPRPGRPGAGPAPGRLPGLPDRAGRPDRGPGPSCAACPAPGRCPPTSWPGWTPRSPSAPADLGAGTIAGLGTVLPMPDPAARRGGSARLAESRLTKSLVAAAAVGLIGLGGYAAINRSRSSGAGAGAQLGVRCGRGRGRRGQLAPPDPDLAAVRPRRAARRTRRPTSRAR